MIRPIAASAAFTGAGLVSRKVGLDQRQDPVEELASFLEISLPDHVDHRPHVMGDFVRRHRNEPVSSGGHEGERHPVIAGEDRETFQPSRENVLDLSQVSTPIP